MDRAKLINLQLATPWSLSPAVDSFPPLLEGRRSRASPSRPLCLYLMPLCASWSGERRLRFDLGVSSVADTSNPSDDEPNAARAHCAPQDPLTGMRSPDECEVVNRTTWPTPPSSWNSDIQRGLAQPRPPALRITHYSDPERRIDRLTNTEEPGIERLC